MDNDVIIELQLLNQFNQESIALLSRIETLISSIIVISGIVIAFILSWYVWRLLLKPLLSSYIKLPL